MVKELNEQNFNENIKEGYSIVDYWASWCRPCLMVAPIVDELSKEMSNIKFFKVDVDANSLLAEKYNIASIPAIFLYKDGELVNKVVGSLPKITLKRWINENAPSA